MQNVADSPGGVAINVIMWVGVFHELPYCRYVLGKF